MKIKLKEYNDKEKYIKLENKNKYDEIHINQKPTNLFLVLLLFSLFLIILIIIIIKIFEINGFNQPKNYIICEEGYKLINGKCEINYTFKAIFYTDFENEKVHIISLVLLKTFF